ncbi:MAG: alpha/beta hydrolase [Aquisalimonadaceae bacterium]
MARHADDAAVFGGMGAAYLDAQYDVEQSVPDFQAYIRDYTARSDAVRSRLDCRLNVAYGAGERQQLDVFPAQSPGSPVNIFIHGGSWRGSSKDSRSFPAEAVVPAGGAWIAINYGLAPAVTLPEIVHQIRQAVQWVWQHARSFNADPERIFVTGNSAGGHLAAMLAVEGWQSDYGLPSDVVKGICPISGIFDMRPICHTGINDSLRMSPGTAESCSPVLHLPKQACPAVIMCGGDEPAEFQRQSVEFSEAWRQAGLTVADEAIIAGENHFSIVGGLGDARHPLGRAMLKLMGLAP